MPNSKKLLQAAAGSAGGAGLGVEDVFSVDLYRGTATTKNIVNGIDLSGEGGLVWTKSRTNSSYHAFNDTERTASASLMPNYPSISLDLGFDAFNSDGYTISGSNAEMNSTTYYYKSLSFRKCPKFFDIQTWTGNGSSNRQISHDLGSIPGMIIVVRTDANDIWSVYHRENDRQTSVPPENYYLNLETNAANGFNSTWWNNTAPTDTNFTVSYNDAVNANGGSYVAYIFAHHDGDGEFGPNADQDIIKCGSYIGNYSTNQIDIGFEPDFLLIKNVNSAADWVWVDQGVRFSAAVDGSHSASVLRPNLNNSESDLVALGPEYNGFKFVNETDNRVNYVDRKYVYLAIRKGPMNPIDSTTPTDFFNVDTTTGSAQSNENETYASDFRVDMAWHRDKTATDNTFITSRTLAERSWKTNTADGSYDNSWGNFDFPTGWGSQFTSNWVASMFRRAPLFFDVLNYTGTGSNRSIPHNLQKAPELMWVKRVSPGLNSGACWFNGFDADEYYILDSADAPSTKSSTTHWNNTLPDEDNFYLGSSVYTNGNSEFFQAYLWTSLDGVCKIGSYTGNGGTINVDCGFSSPARFVHIKRYDASFNNLHWNSESGINTGTEYTYLFNATSRLTVDYIDPYATGFTTDVLNANGSIYYFIALA